MSETTSSEIAGELPGIVNSVGEGDRPPNHKLFLCKTIYLYSTLTGCDRLCLYYVMYRF